MGGISSVRPYQPVQLIGDVWRRLNLSEIEVKLIILKLREQDCEVVQFGREGWDCEVDGTQIFRATRLGEDRFHVRLNSAVFPDL